MRIRWRDGPASLPPALVILSDEGSEVVTRLHFEGCGTAGRLAGRALSAIQAANSHFPCNPYQASGNPFRTLPGGAGQ